MQALQGVLYHKYLMFPDKLQKKPLKTAINKCKFWKFPSAFALVGIT